jgi:hypothetical protein
MTVMIRELGCDTFEPIVYFASIKSFKSSLLTCNLQIKIGFVVFGYVEPEILIKPNRLLRP